MHVALYASEQLRWHIWPTFPLKFFMKFSQKMPLYFFYTMVQTSQKWPKTQIGGGGGPALKLLPFLLRQRRELTAGSDEKKKTPTRLIQLSVFFLCPRSKEGLWFNMEWPRQEWTFVLNVNVIVVVVVFVVVLVLVLLSYSFQRRVLPSSLRPYCGLTHHLYLCLLSDSSSSLLEVSRGTGPSSS